MKEDERGIARGWGNARVIAVVDYSFSSRFPGGLIGLAATAIALGRDCHAYTGQLVSPVLACFGDPDSRVRYYACEALYNIVKVARASVLLYFNDVFDRYDFGTGSGEVCSGCCFVQIAPPGRRLTASFFVISFSMTIKSLVEILPMFHQCIILLLSVSLQSFQVGR